MTEHSPTATPEERDEFYIDPKKNEAGQDAAEMTEVLDSDFIDLVTVKEGGAPTVRFEDRPPEEQRAFTLVERATTGRSERMLMFEELRGLADAAAAAVERNGATFKGRLKKAMQRGIVASAIAIGMTSAAAPQTAEAGQRGQRQRRVATIVSIASEVGGALFDAKSHEHAQMARELGRLEKEFDRLKERIERLNVRIGRAQGRKQQADSERLKQRYQEQIDELEMERQHLLQQANELADILEQEASEGRTARSEAEKARRDATRARIAQMVERESRRIGYRGW